MTLVGKLRCRAFLAISVAVALMPRAALATSAEVAVIARAEVDVWGCACMFDWRYFQRTHVDIIITSDKCDALIVFFSDLDDLGGETEISGTCRKALAIRANVAPILQVIITSASYN